MPVDIDRLLVNRITTGVLATFQDTLTEMRSALPQPYRLVSGEVPSGSEAELHNFIENIGPLREWNDDKVFNRLAERMYLVTNKRYEKSVEINMDKVSDRGVGSAPVDAGKILATSADEFDDRSVWLAGYNVADTSLIGYDGVSLINASHPIGDKTFDNEHGGSGARWFLVSMKFGMGPVNIQRREDYAIKAQDDPQSEPMFNRRHARYSVEARLRIFAGLPQLIWGSKEALTGANIDVGIQAMGAFPDASGEPMGIMPTHLVFGRSNRRTALTVLGAELVQGTDAGISNIDKGIMTPVYAPRLA